MHGWTQPQDIGNVVNVPGIQIRLSAPSLGCNLIVTDWLDTFAAGAGNGVCLTTPAITDMIVRAQRDTVANVLSVQVWNASGSGQPITGSLPFVAAGTPALPTQMVIGDTETNGILDYVRWFSTTVPAGTNPFLTSPGDLADFEFEGNMADNSAQNLALTPNIAVSYSNSLTYPPLASQGAQRVFRAGAPATLDSSQSAALNGSPALTYQWSQVSGPTQLQFSSAAAASPTITGLVFGSYQIQLTVTDSSGQSGSNVLKYGSVFTNSQDVVIPPQGHVTSILGPMLRLGANPWPYFDSSNQAMANFFGSLQSSDYLDIWNSAQPGTVTLTNGSTAVTGSGTTFQSTFCGGGTVGYNNATLIVGYPVPNSPGQFGRAPYSVASCQSDTALTLQQPYGVSPSASNLNFSAMDNNAIGTWIGGSSNANYYDNVMAFYSLYYRSGIDDYLTYARTLADRWYTMPWFDQGRAALNGSTTLFPRLQSITGLVLRALDGHPEYWSGIEQYLAFDYSFASALPSAGALGDIREQGYATAFLALGALYDPKPVNQALYKVQLEQVISTVWAPAAQPGGNWVNMTNGYSTWNGTGGTVNVTNGSNVVTGNQTNWQPGWVAGNSFWTADPNGVTNGDTVAYTATVLSPTQIQLNTPYVGPTSTTARGWEANSLVGVGTQPFMLGVVGSAFGYAYQATGDVRLPGYLNGIENWFASQGYRPDARGLWYGRGFPNCEPIAPTNLACSGGSAEQSRFLSGEIVGALSAAYLTNSNTAAAAFGDNIYGAMFGGPGGGPGADGVYVTDVAPGGWAMQNKLAKDFGFFYGFGGGASWPAARLGATAQAPAVGCSFSLTQSSGSIPSTGGTGTLNVIASDPSCAWTAVSNSSAVTVTAGAVSSGTGTATYAVAANSGPTPLTATMTVADQTFTITESGVVCGYSLAPTVAAFTNASATGSINVAAAASSCGWTAASSVPWITLTGSTAGSGNGVVTYAIAANTGTGNRSGSVSVGGQTFSVTQAATGCGFALDQTSAQMTSSGGSGTIAVATSGGGCTWTAVSNASFIKITGGSKGQVSYMALANNLPLSRTGTMTIAGVTFTLSQSGTSGVDGPIGTPLIGGSASVNNGVYTVSGAGTAIWNTYDQFNFDHWQCGTSATITARLTGLTAPGNYAKAGVMIRQSVAQNAPNVFAMAMPTSAGAQVRLKAGATTTSVSTGSVTFPMWLRANVANGVLTTYNSSDGNTWNQIGTPQTIQMLAPVCGLAVSSQDVNAAATATFDNVSITNP